MAFIARLICLFSLLCLPVAGFAAAGIVANNGITWYYVEDLSWLGKNGSGPFDTPAEACEADQAPQILAVVMPETITATGAQCDAQWRDGGGHVAYTTIASTCVNGIKYGDYNGPLGSQFYAGCWSTTPPPPPTCRANQELDEETNTCVCKHGPAGAFAVSGDVMTGCNDGCTIYLTSGSYSKSTNKTYGSWNQNTNTCSPSPESPEVDSPDSPDGQDAGKCPTGQCPGTFNGQFMCVPCKGKESSDSSSSENTTETPNGASAPSGSASQSQSGSKSTECEGGVCTTKETVVIRNPDGSTTEKQKETTESISDYCAKNPNAAICKTEEAGQWGGACAGGFQCKGDAVQCAQAQAAWKAACLFDVASDDPNVVKGGQAMSSDQSALRAQLGLDDTGDNFNLSSMIDSDPLFAAGGGCPADQQVTLLGQSLTLSLSSWCSWLQTAGTILQAAAYLAAALIVFRRG